jgi:hypothetical protein
MTTTHPALSGLGHGRCLVIGEVALTHDGSLGLAHAFVDAIAGAGADAVKFQTHIAAAESTPSEPFRVKFSRQDATRYEYWQRMEFTEAQWQGLADHCRERGVLFISSPFSIEAVDLLERVGQPIWKIASGEVSNPRLLDRVLETGAPVLLSTGMSALAETDAAVARVRRAAARWACCSAPRRIRARPRRSASTWCRSIANATAAGPGLPIIRPRFIRASPARPSAWTCWKCTSRSRATCSVPT